MQSPHYHIFHLSSAHPPDLRIFDKEACTLAAAGHRVEVWVRYHRSEVKQGVVLHPVPVVKSRGYRMFFIPLWLLRESLRRPADFYHLHDPELLPIGMLLALVGKKVIYDVHEDLPGSILTKLWIAAPLRRAISGLAWILEKAAARLLTGFVPATHSIARRFPPERTQVVQNLPRLEEFAIHSGQRNPLTQTVVFAYVGALTELRGALQMLDALALMPPHFSLTIMGEISPPALSVKLSLHPAWHRVRFLGQRSREEATGLLMSAHAGLVLFHPAPNHIEAQPNKLFEYMAAGLPVIASNFPLWSELIVGTQCGLVVDPLDPVSIAGAMYRVAANPDFAFAMGARGRAAVYKRLNWSSEGVLLVRFYSRLAHEHDHPIV